MHKKWIATAKVNIDKTIRELQLSGSFHVVVRDLSEISEYLSRLSHSPSFKRFKS